MDKNQFICTLTVIIQTLVTKIKKKFKISYEEALEGLYNSRLYQALEDEETKMWYFCTNDLLNMYVQEKETGDYFKGYE